MKRRGSHGVVQHQQAARLQPLGALNSLADNFRAFLRDLKAGLPDTTLMQENVSLRARRRLYEAITFRKIEPFYRTCDFERLTRIDGCNMRFHPLPPRSCPEIIQGYQKA